MCASLLPSISQEMNTCAFQTNNYNPKDSHTRIQFFFWVKWTDSMHTKEMKFGTYFSVVTKGGNFHIHFKNQKKESLNDPSEKEIPW